MLELIGVLFMIGAVIGIGGILFMVLPLWALALGVLFVLFLIGSFLAGSDSGPAKPSPVSPEILAKRAKAKQEEIERYKWLLAQNDNDEDRPQEIKQRWHDHWTKKIKEEMEEK